MTLFKKTTITFFTFLAIIFLLIAIIIILPAETARAEESNISIDERYFPDSYFRNYVLKSCDTDSDTKLSESEISAITKISVNSSEITSLKGIEYFTSLTTLECSGNHISELDLSKNLLLTKLDCSNNKITNLNISRNIALTELNCSNTSPSKLDLSHNVLLTKLNCSHAKLPNLTFPKIPLSQNCIVSITELPNLTFRPIKN